MSELFDSLNLSTSAGPSSSQQSSSQPSTSKVFWHASPSPGVLRQLANWTPSKSQESPTLPLCTQAFVGELKKLPGALEAQSPLIGRDSAKRKKLLDTPRTASRHVSDPSANRSRAREYITIDLTDDDEDDAEASGPRRLLLGDAGESSPESRRRRTMDAGNTGRLRSSSPSQYSGNTTRTAATEKDPQASIASHRRQDRRPPRRRKKESFIAGLGFTDNAGGATDCLKLFEDLQAAIQGMQNGPRPSTSGSAEIENLRPTVTFDRSSEGGGLTPREGINRTFSAPIASRAQLSQQEGQNGSQQAQGAVAVVKDDPLTPRRGLRPVKSDHDVFRPAGHTPTRPLQPRPINVPAEAAHQARSAGRDNKAAAATIEQARSAAQLESKPGNAPSTPSAAAPRAPAPQPARTSATRAQPVKPAPAPLAEPSPVKRSARIEARQQTVSSNKKLGVRGPSLLSKSVSPHTKPSPLKVTPSRMRTHPLPPGMSQARQVGLPRSCSQFAPSQTAAGTQSATVGGVGPAAPFRPPAIHARVAAAGNVVRATEKRAGQPASSDDSFGDVDDDAAFLALACELEY
ncbi:hypothetical protein PSEUBRA_000174 [Kalmanozyma brasiliensis GHG001]|uniref:Uncharacterized protein n=1 Tax=Kalmanozyma brasiliensis (strain GHG001) TaxID=1365824 RepID=V5EW66_KALBG|nr:uncharacterized protein PSEUBRA_000174 [Kalmanozyma brasiliensis GHG001]EST09790.1 hypothetical protein PSEUBRA_000174 [Kalmanozyma brasiliensis GHG001]